MKTITTEQGDTPDLIALREMGRTHLATEALLRANRGLAAKGPVFEQGIEVVIPDWSPPVETTTTTRIWGSAA